MAKFDPRVGSKEYARPDQVDQIVALSGGIDSAAILATRHITKAVFVDYGQPAAIAEREASRRLAERFEVDWVDVSVSNMRLGEMIDETGKPGLRVVQARNTVIAALCANQAGPVGGYVYFGAHAGDEQYGDCQPRFFDFLSLAMNEAYGVSVHAPNLRKTKAEVTAELAEVLRDYDFYCWSCYTPRAGAGDRLEACGTCNSCEARA